MANFLRTFWGTVDAAGGGRVTIVVTTPEWLDSISEGDKVHVTYLHDDTPLTGNARILHELEMLDTELCTYLGPVASELAIPRRRLLSLMAGLRDS